MVPKRAAESDAELKIFFADPERIKEIAIYLVSPGSPYPPYPSPGAVVRGYTTRIKRGAAASHRAAPLVPESPREHPMFARMISKHTEVSPTPGFLGRVPRAAAEFPVDPAAKCVEPFSC